MSTEAAEVVVSVNASQNTQAVDTAADQLEHFGETLDGASASAQKGTDSLEVLDEAADELTKNLTRLAGAAAIGAFFKEAIDEALKEAEALRQLRFAVEATGSSWERYGEQIEAFSSSQQALTRFDNTETFGTLSRILRVTGDVASAMKGAALAQDIASSSGKDLSATTELLANLLAGQERAVMQARKEYGAFVGDARTAQGALDGLARGFTGAAVAEDSHTKSLAQTKAFLGDFAKDIGTALLPVLNAVGAGVKFFVKGLEEAIVVMGGLAGEVNEFVRLALTGLQQLLTFDFSGSINGWKNYGENRAALWQSVHDKLLEIESRYNGRSAAGSAAAAALKAKADEEEAKRAAEARQAINDKLAGQVVAAIDGELAAKRFALDQEISAAQEAGVQQISFMQEGVNTTVSLAEYRAQRILQIEAEVTAKMAQEHKKQAADEKKANDERKKLEDDRKKNFASTLNFISTLSTAKNKELAIIGKAAAGANAFINTAEAITVALRSAPPPLNFALAAAVGAAGAAQIAAIAGVQLEKGGLVPGSPGGTAATIGEKGKPEAVLPLTDSRAMKAVGDAIARAGSGGGATINNYNTFVLPGLEAARDPAVARAILEILAEQMEKGDPGAVRAARRTVDLAELNAGRA